MSQQAMSDFLSALPQNPALAERFRNVVARNDGPAAIEAIAGVASGAGYAVDTGDVAAFRADAIETLDDGELDDDRLDRVAGGELFTIGALTLTAVVAVASTGVLAGGTVVAAIPEVRDFFGKW